MNFGTPLWLVDPLQAPLSQAVRVRLSVSSYQTTVYFHLLTPSVNAPRNKSHQPSGRSDFHRYREAVIDASRITFKNFTNNALLRAISKIGRNDS